MECNTWCAATITGWRFPPEARIRLDWKKNDGSHTVFVYSAEVSHTPQGGERVIDSMRDWLRLRPNLFRYVAGRQCESEWICSVSIDQCLEHQHCIGSC